MSLILPKESNIILCIGAAELLSSQILGENELGCAGGDTLANRARDEHPDLPGVGAIAQSMMVGLLRKRVKEIGHGETVDEPQREFLLAVERMAENGFSGGSVFILPMLRGSANWQENWPKLSDRLWAT